jgi:integrase/recombinase XerD
MNTLRQAMQDYLAIRRGLGFKMHDAGLRLPEFVSFLEQRQTSHVTNRLALEWAQQVTSARPAEWAKRLSFVRGFARYRSSIDPLTEIPPWGLLPHRASRAKPYLYTSEEVMGLLRATLGLSPAWPSTELRPWTYYCLFGLLCVSGLRISEALDLKVGEVDLDEAVLTINETKFGNSRLVPIHPSTRTALADYLSRREQFLAGRQASYLFVSNRGNRLDAGQVRRTFYALSRQTGLRKPGASHGPRLHDFRHRFASETLLHWYQSGQDVERRLPVLSTYLGHVHVADTYWYLSAWPELMSQAMVRLERRWGNPS